MIDDGSGVLHGFVVGIGASAGGLEALEAFLRSVPAGSGLTYIIVQHLSPDHKSHMVELLSKHTSMSVVLAEQDMSLAPDVVYLIPPKKTLAIHGNVLRLAERGSGLALPIDVLFHSLAEERGARAAAVVLSGTGSDGARGARAVNAAGGLVLVQEPETAKFDGMPRAAIGTGIVDQVLPVAAMAASLSAFASRSIALVKGGPTSLVDEGSAYERTTALLRRQTGVDFSKYKSTTILRRLQRRMAVHQVDSLHAYVGVLQESPREVAALFKELLISVTKFFRDAEVFATLAREVIPSIVERTRPGESIRIWAAGCATGEEAYSLAMLFEEYFESGGRPRDVKIFATDIDRDALDFAGAGIYPESIATDLSPERLERFFVAKADSYQVSRFLRQRVVFANHDVTHDPPFGRVCLVSCRNLLIYFNQEMQQRVISGFRFALRPGGYLLLGKSESPGELGTELEPLSGGAKVYRRTEVRPRPGDVRYGALLTPARVTGAWPVPGPRHASLDPRVAEAYELLMEAHAPPSVLVTEQHEVVHLLGTPSPLVRFGAGSASLNLLQLLPPAVASVVGIATHRVARSDQEVRYHAVPTDHGLATVTVRPVPSRGGTRLFVVSFILDRTNGAADELASVVPADAERQIVDLQQELQYSRENLQATIEELETSNEELQATNEEMVASNEELQSTNEELQSVNEELHTLNAEYQHKIVELIRLNDDINNLLSSTRLGCLFLDPSLHVTRFTPAIRQFMNLLDRDIGRPVGDISFKFDTEPFFAMIDEVGMRGTEVEREIQLPGGQAFVMRVAPYLTESSSHSGFVVTVLDVSGVALAERRMARVLDALPNQVALLNRAGTITSVNRAWCDFGARNGARSEATGVGVNYLGVCRNSKLTAERELAQRLSELLDGRARTLELEYPCHSPTEKRWFLMQACSIDEGGAVVSHVDITSRKLLELRLSEASSDGGT